MSRKYPFLTPLRNRSYRAAVVLQRAYLRHVWGVTLGEGVRISRTAKIDKTNARGVIIGDYTAVAFGAAILTHDFVGSRHMTTTIGSNCFIGAHAIVMPGVTIGDNCIVAALALVARDVPSSCVVMGNPAKVVERDIVTGKWGNRIEIGDRSE